MKYKKGIIRKIAIFKLLINQIYKLLWIIKNLNQSRVKMLGIINNGYNIYLPRGNSKKQKRSLALQGKNQPSFCRWLPGFVYCSRWVLGQGFALRNQTPNIVWIIKLIFVPN